MTLYLHMQWYLDPVYRSLSFFQLCQELLSQSEIRSWSHGASPALGLPPFGCPLGPEDHVGGLMAVHQ